MNWIVLYKESLCELKSRDIRLLVWAAEWDDEPYEIIRWDGKAWDCLSMQHESCSCTTLNDEEVIKLFQYYIIIKQPRYYG